MLELARGVVLALLASSQYRHNVTLNNRAGERRGRPPGTTPRELELIALRLFADKGFDETTVDDLAAAANVTSRTFFRKFQNKADVLWQGFDDEVESLRAALAGVPGDVGWVEAIRRAILSVNHYTAADIPELRTRMHLISTVPALQASAAVRYDAWERTVSEFVADRTATSPTDMIPLVVGRTTLAACRAAYDVWANQTSGELAVYLENALDVFEAGFNGLEGAIESAIGNGAN